MTFSIIVVCLNAGEKLNQTLDSILSQSCTDYEIVVKDGGSKDGSIEKISKDKRVCLFVEKDKGIYDAMNQAVSYAKGEYVLFLNCGDVFYDNGVLEKTKQQIERDKKKVSSFGNGKEMERMVFYGDTYSAKNQVMIVSAPKITGFTCYRNIPCHQSCFYDIRLCKEKPYNQEYRIRADYDHFLWCYYKANAKMVHMNVVVASYEGGGYSESAENQKRDKEEHKLITREYMGKGELWKYQFIMLVTLAPLRRFLAENKTFSGVYHKVKEKLYH